MTGNFVDPAEKRDLVFRLDGIPLGYEMAEVKLYSEYPSVSDDGVSQVARVTFRPKMTQEIKKS